MVQCSSCRSYNEAGSAFCNQCGVPLEGKKGRKRRRRAGRGFHGFRVFTALLVLAALIVVIVIATTPEPVKSPAGRGPFPSWSRPPPRGLVAGREKETGEAYSIEPLSPTEIEDNPLDLRGIVEAVQPALVVLDLRTEDGRPLRETLGVIVDSAGVVLSRFRPLLGAQRGTCRLYVPEQPRVDILGVSYTNEELDLALVRIARSPVGYPMVNLLPEDPAAVIPEGDPVFVFSGHRGIETKLAEVYRGSADGYRRLRLENTPELPVDVFLAVDAYGFAVGLCRLEVNGRLLSSLKSPGREPYRVLVDPVASLAGSLSRDVGWRLAQITRMYYEGTFPDLFARGMLAYRQGRYREAIDLLAPALDRSLTDRADEEDIQQAREALRECYLEEARRLLAGKRDQEAVLLLEAAAARYAEDPVLLVLLGQARFSRGDWGGGIEALVHARELEPSERVDTLLEQGYLALSAQAGEAQDLAAQEAGLLEGIEMLPESGNLRLELAKLYVRFEAYDGAIRLLQDVRQLSPQLRGPADSLLERIDDVLKRREAVIIPIDPQSRSIRTQVTVEGRTGARSLEFVIDTGATYTTIPSDIASELGYGAEGKPMSVKTAGGIIGGRLIQVRSLDVGGYAVRNLEVLVLPSRIAPEFGLLGLNFLKYFEYSVDHARSEFRLERQ